MASSNETATSTKQPLRLRVPASLAVAVVGASASVAMSFGGCQEESMPDPVDAGVIDKVRDAGVDDTTLGDDGDAGVPLDAGDVPPASDGYVPPPDAPDH